MRLYEFDTFPLDVKTLTIDELAKLHQTDVNNIIQELKIGLEVEGEHTSDKKAAMEIALDHLKEDPKYYTKLKSLNL